MEHQRIPLDEVNLMPIKYLYSSFLSKITKYNGRQLELNSDQLAQSQGLLQHQRVLETSLSFIFSQPCLSYDYTHHHIHHNTHIVHNILPWHHSSSFPLIGNTTLDTLIIILAITYISFIDFVFMCNNWNIIRIIILRKTNIIIIFHFLS